MAMTATAVKAPDFHVIDEKGVLHVNYHAGQSRAMRSKARVVAVIAGTQSGKTVMGPHWLLREIQSRGPRNGS